MYNTNIKIKCIELPTFKFLQIVKLAMQITRCLHYNLALSFNQFLYQDGQLKFQVKAHLEKCFMHRLGILLFFIVLVAFTFAIKVLSITKLVDKLELNY